MVSAPSSLVFSWEGPLLETEQGSQATISAINWHETPSDRQATVAANRFPSDDQ